MMLLGGGFWCIVWVTLCAACSVDALTGKGWSNVKERASRWKRFSQRPQNLVSEAGLGSGSPVSARAAVRASLSSAMLRSLLLSAGFVQQTSLKAAAATASSADGDLDCVGAAAVLDGSADAAVKGSNRPVRTKPFDERQFRAIELDNKLRVLLVSDPSSSRSAAAMDVRAGSFSDPYAVPGLAHFCEHMSFLGTKKFPKEDEFSSFLASHGGSSNAYTDSEDTVYYFDVNAEYTEEALDRFAQFFIGPLFTSSATARELNAIDSEHAKNINNDGFRLYQLDKDGANPAHPLSKFSTGNKDTLEKDALAQGIDVRKLLLDFHGARYSSNRMTLCIVGAQGLGQLERWARALFKDVPNRDAPDPADEWWGKVPPFLPQTEATVLEVVPVGEQRSVTLTWPIWVLDATQRAALLRSKPDQIVAHLLGHEGRGSLRSFLVARGWGNGVQASVGTDVSDLQAFEVTVDLTDEGLRHRDDVVDAVFAYLHAMRDAPLAAVPKIPAYVFNEVRQLAAVAFNYSEKPPPSSQASSAVANMQDYADPADYLTGPALYEHPDPCAVQSYLTHLTPANARVKVVARDFAGKTTETARFYGTQFSNRTLPTQTKRWAETLRNGGATYASLRLPEPNLLIPERFELLSRGGPAQPPSVAQQRAWLDEPPKKLREDATWTLWHKLDRSFAQPKVYAILQLAVPADRFNEDFVVRSKLFSYCFLDSLNEFLYDARLAGLGFELDFTNKGVQIIFSGFNDKMLPFVRSVTRSLKDYTPDAATFARYKDLLMREFLSWRTQQPYSHCSHFAALCTETLQFRIPDTMAALERVAGPASLRGFLDASIAASHGTALVVGNVDEQGAADIVDSVGQTFAWAPLPLELRSRRRTVLIPPAPPSASGYRVARPEPNKEDDNSAVTFYFQQPSRAVADTVLVELLAEALEQAFYNSLRTQQQLGYIVFSGVRARDGVYSLVLTVQSAVVGGGELARRVEAFVEAAVADLAAGLTDEDLDAFKEGLAVRKLEPDQRLTDQAGRFWGEIMEVASRGTDAQPLFDRAALEVAAIRGVDKAAFVRFARGFLTPGGAQRRLLVSQVSSQKEPAAMPAPTAAADAQTPPLSVPVALAEIADEFAFRTAQKFL